ncbi:hypothetical protein HF563_02120, partial [Acidithiobacillus ferridurans]|nr:hypothetical protein [Acidithiobacillus ferridurans]
TVWGNGGNQTTPYLLADASFDTVSGQVYLGSDTSATPTAYGVILNQTQLQNINQNLSGKFVLGTNLTLGGGGTSGNFSPIGFGNSSNTAFTGVFDGLGHTINNLSINLPGSSAPVGLFSFLAQNSIVRNVGLVGGSIKGNGVVGTLVGLNYGSVSNAYSSVNVLQSGTNVGGLIGINWGSVSNVYATGSVTSTNNVGGLVGLNQGITLNHAYATGAVSGTKFVGGLVGVSGQTITNTYATGSVNGSTGVGGLVGFSSNTISNSYATGKVTGTSNTGGLLGSNYITGKVINSYWDTTTSGIASTGVGINHANASDVSVTGLTTAQLAAALPTGFSNTVWGNGGN